jgi:hypothetical protein
MVFIVVVVVIIGGLVVKDIENEADAVVEAVVVVVKMPVGMVKEIVPILPVVVVKIPVLMVVVPTVGAVVVVVVKMPVGMVKAVVLKLPVVVVPTPVLKVVVPILGAVTVGPAAVVVAGAAVVVAGAAVVVAGAAVVVAGAAVVVAGAAVVVAAAAVSPGTMVVARVSNAEVVTLVISYDCCCGSSFFLHPVNRTPVTRITSDSNNAKSCILFIFFILSITPKSIVRIYKMADRYISYITLYAIEFLYVKDLHHIFILKYIKYYHMMETGHMIGFFKPFRASSLNGCMFFRVHI